ncbi:MAG TPA: Uma2 family endonuclease [Thermomicrobiales bacterium]|nr:Uma2 family endonuclease [Thermomicrobiales bacterium]
MAMPDDGYRYELVRGELVRLPMSAHQSSRIAIRIANRIGPFVEAGNLGNIAGADGAYIFARDPYTVRIPDLSFVRAERLPPPDAWVKFLELAPDLAVEVVSPSDSANEIQDKVNEYLDVGVRLIWVVYPIQHTITVYSADRIGRVLTDADTLDGGDVLPGFSLPVAEIFA